ncbi:MAG: ABC transporter permease [Alphaproteobacteria bacterium]|uniref:ABC transporter permease n=1 Tax=Candidatus Nitrobium versatile TaxID=2884831 RepID=A0A953SHK0_9BACT|nr:ABC transporter permease [Candidatus Nitrobium versatile]
MSLSKVISLSLRGLSKYKMRTFLMMLGIIIGIATLTAIVFISKGAQVKIMKGIKSFGTNAIMVSAGGGKMFGSPDDETTTLTLEDAAAIRESVRDIQYIAPFTVSVSQDIIYGNRNAGSSVLGVTPEWMDAWQWYVDRGEFISEEDNNSLSRNCVIGRTVARELFGDQNPLGETIRINNTGFKVIGVLRHRGTSPMGMDMDRRVLVPMTTAMKRLFNITHVGMIRMHVEDETKLREVTMNVSALLRERHHITPPQEDDFRVTNTMKMSMIAKGVSGTLRTFLLLLSVISLGVGGIVIANIMFISVNERKREIGIRRAFGARARDIMRQFLGEALVVTGSGGFAGTLLGIAISKGISLIPIASSMGPMGKKKMMTLPVVISWEPFVLAFLFSALIGVLAGMQPAKKAASMDPVEAIRG